MIPPASMFAVLLLIVALIFTQVRRSDRKPATRPAHTADDERLASTGDLTEDEATLEWFKSLREPRRVVSYAYNPARYVVLEQTAPGWTHTPAWLPLERPVPAVPAGAENTAGTGPPAGETDWDPDREGPDESDDVDPDLCTGCMGLDDSGHCDGSRSCGCPCGWSEDWAEQDSDRPLCYCGRPGNHITAAAINGSDMDAEFATGQLQAVTS